MDPRTVAAAALSAALVASAPDARVPVAKCDKHLDTFNVPAETVFALVKTIALTQVSIEPTLSDSVRDRGRVAIDSDAAQELRGAGFTVVPPALVDSVWRHTVDSVGPMFDPRTGQADSTKVAGARAALVASLRAGYSADALLYLQVRLVNAEFEKWTATWDGTEESWGNFGHRFMGGLLHGTYKGRTNALTLFATLMTTTGRRLYDGKGGLQVYLLPDNGKFVNRPDSVFFVDTARSAHSVHLALCGLVTRTGT